MELVSRVILLVSALIIGLRKLKHNHAWLRSLLSRGGRDHGLSAALMGFLAIALESPGFCLFALIAAQRKKRMKMRCTYLGHAGFQIRTSDCCILCDPWHSANPVFFDSWSPYPANHHLDWDSIQRETTVLYVSHNHRAQPKCRDHLDLKNLALMPDKSIPVLLPRLQFCLLREEFEALGFTNLIEGEMTLGNTRMCTLVSETTNREMEDSMLVVDDGETSMVNANDCKLEAHIQAELNREYPDGVDIYTGQYSGAAWHPMCYAGSDGFTRERVAELCNKHCNKTLHRFITACKALKAKKCVPGSGPAAFLSEDLFKYNFFSRAESAHTSIFPDAYQIGFEGAWDKAASSMLCRVNVGDSFTFDSLEDTPEDPVGDKRRYLELFKKESPSRECSAHELDRAVTLFCEHLDLILNQYGTQLSSVIRVNLFVKIESEAQPLLLQIMLDASGRVEKKLCTPDQPLAEPYYLVVIPGYIFIQLVAQNQWDWEEAFLGLRCRFERKPDLYNSWILAFFKNMTLERMELMCSNLASSSRQTMALEQEQTFDKDGYRIQKFCPHQGLDLSVHGVVSDGKIRCLGHGLEWDLKTGEGINTTCPISCKTLEW